MTSRVMNWRAVSRIARSSSLSEKSICINYRRKFSGSSGAGYGAWSLGRRLALAEGEPMARPRQSLLTRQRIVNAAAALVDAEGLQALSVRRLATELGVQGPSLYNHFATKAEILDAVADAVVAGRGRVGVRDVPWCEALRRWARSYHAVLTRTRTSCRCWRTAPAAARRAGDGRHRLRRADRRRLVPGGPPTSAR
jgi:AcrR family transcriptional regulator